MQRLVVASNYKGRGFSQFKGRIIRISGSIIHIQMENGRFIAFNKDCIFSGNEIQIEGEEVEVLVNRQVPASS